MKGGDKARESSIRSSRGICDDASHVRGEHDRGTVTCDHRLIGLSLELNRGNGTDELRGPSIK